MEDRHELKFIVSDIDLEILKYRLQVVMKPDRHQKEGSYTIRSLYFDDYQNSCMKENEDGIDQRRKYRLRIYDGSNEVIKLEKKSKDHGMTRKNVTSISIEDCRAYMAGKELLLRKTSSDLEKELWTERKTSGMHPVCIVEYERTAFVEPRGNVRVTFDRNISGSSNIMEFLDKPSLVPVLPKGQHVLEVKYDELLPDYIAQCLEIGRLQRTSFSKYYYVRRSQIF